MDTILGICSFDSKRQVKACFEKMQEADAGAKSMSKSTWSNPEASIFLYSSHGQLYTSAEQVTAGCGRIFNRNGEAVNKEKQATASYINSAAHLNCTELFQQLIGDWSGATYNLSSGELLLANAFCGNVSLYYYVGSGFVAFSTLLKPLLVLDSIPKTPNIPAIVSLLVTHTLHTDETIFKNIRALKSGSIAKINPKKGSLSLQAYEDHGQKPPNKGKTIKAYRKEGIELFRKVTEERINSANLTGLSLSGGLDSATIAALAAPYLKRRGEKLSTYTFLKLFDDFKVQENWYKDEKVPVDQIVDFVGNIKSTFNRSEDSHHIDTIDRLIDNGVIPPYEIISVPWVMDLMQMANDDQVDQFIVGIMGNATISFRGLHHQLKSSLKRRIRYILPAVLVEPIIQRLRRQTVDWKRHSFLSENHFNKLDANGFFEETGIRTKHNTRIVPRKELIREMKLDGGRAGQFIKEISVIKGIHTTDPTYDPRVVDFCLNAPQELFGSKNGNRLLIRKGMKGLLPENVLNNPKRGAQVADLFQRMQSDLKRIKSRYEQIKVNNLAKELLDLDKMDQFIAAMENNESKHILECNAFLRTLGIFSFLKCYSQ